MAGIGRRAARIVADLNTAVDAVRAAGGRVAAYGAAGKATTLLTSAGLDADRLAFVADLNPAKHGFFMPGTDLEIVPPERLRAERPEAVVILAWNFAEEILDQLADLRAAGTRCILPIPELKVV
ncbi:MAG: methyltransferase C-terminal domain-containing protein [Pseudomonadota bacterium]